MITRIGLAPRRTGLSIHQFQAHWRGTHAMLVATLVAGLRRNWQNHALLRDGEPLLPWPGFDACSEMDFDNLPAMHAALDVKRPADELSQDTAYLINQRAAAPMIAERIHMGGRIDLNHVRLMTFMRCSAHEKRADLHLQLQIMAIPQGAQARELYLAIADRGGGPVSSFDALEVLWFETPGPAQQHVVSEQAREQRQEIAHMVHGVERVIAQARVNL